MHYDIRSFANDINNTARIYLVLPLGHVRYIVVTMLVFLLNLETLEMV